MGIRLQQAVGGGISQRFVKMTYPIRDSVSYLVPFLVCILTVTVEMKS